jgi:hypothetical protein
MQSSAKNPSVESKEKKRDDARHSDNNAERKTVEKSSRHVL